MRMSLVSARGRPALSKSFIDPCLKNNPFTTQTSPRLDGRIFRRARAHQHGVCWMPRGILGDVSIGYSVSASGPGLSDLPMPHKVTDRFRKC